MVPLPLPLLPLLLSTCGAPPCSSGASSMSSCSRGLAVCMAGLAAASCNWTPLLLLVVLLACP